MHYCCILTGRWWNIKKHKTWFVSCLKHLIRRQAMNAKIGVIIEEVTNVSQKIYELSESRTWLITRWIVLHFKNSPYWFPLVFYTFSRNPKSQTLKNKSTKHVELSSHVKAGEKRKVRILRSGVPDWESSQVSRGFEQMMLEGIRGSQNRIEKWLRLILNLSPSLQLCLFWSLGPVL